MSLSFKSQTVIEEEEEKMMSYLCCNTRMVTTRDPQYSVALHPPPDGLKIHILLLHQKICLLKQSDSILYQRQLLCTTFCISDSNVVVAVTIEPESLLQLQLEHGPGAEYQSRLVEGYTERRSDPQREITSPDGHDSRTF